MADDRTDECAAVHGALVRQAAGVLHGRGRAPRAMERPRHPEEAVAGPVGARFRPAIGWPRCRRSSTPKRVISSTCSPTCPTPGAGSGEADSAAAASLSPLARGYGGRTGRAGADWGGVCGDYHRVHASRIARGTRESRRAVGSGASDCSRHRNRTRGRQGHAVNLARRSRIAPGDFGRAKRAPPGDGGTARRAQGRNPRLCEQSREADVCISARSDGSASRDRLFLRHKYRLIRKYTIRLRRRLELNLCASLHVSPPWARSPTGAGGLDFAGAGRPGSPARSWRSAPPSLSTHSRIGGAAATPCSVWRSRRATAISISFAAVADIASWGAQQTLGCSAIPLPMPGRELSLFRSEPKRRAACLFRHNAASGSSACFSRPTILTVQLRNAARSETRHRRSQTGDRRRLRRRQSLRRSPGCSARRTVWQRSHRARWRGPSTRRSPFRTRWTRCRYR